MGRFHNSFVRDYGTVLQGIGSLTFAIFAGDYKCMSATVPCSVHGENQRAFVCTHLLGDSSGMGFHHEDASVDDPLPDAWCADCELIRSESGGWGHDSENLCEFAVICSECYERARIRNVRPAVTLDGLAHLRWKCSSCEEWHIGPILDLSFSQPWYWSDAMQPGVRWGMLPSGKFQETHKSFLDEDYCAINEESFFIRGLLHLPILGTGETFRWGIWGSLSRENFETVLRREASPGSIETPPMFSWLSSQIGDYPDTLNLKMYAHFQGRGERPHFRLENADHPLSREYHRGISPERVKEIMFRSLPAQPK